MLKYAYYPGCSLSSIHEFHKSSLAVFSRMGIELAEIPDWSCCGSSPTHKVDRDMATVIAGRNLVLANGIGDIMAPCASCYMNLKEAYFELEHNDTLQGVLAEAGYEYKPGGVQVLSAVEAIYRALETGLLADKVTKPLSGLKVASYYGCLLVRPPEIAQFDDPENPVSMDKIVEAVGAIPIEWSHKVDCCGNAYILVDRNMTQNLVSNILNAAIDAAVDVIVTACPLCQQNLALRQRELKKSYGLKKNIPVVYFTQLMGVAMGIDNRQLDVGGDVLSLIDKRQREAKEVD